jgi:hypothetical protein
VYGRHGLIRSDCNGLVLMDRTYYNRAEIAIRFYPGIAPMKNTTARKRAMPGEIAPRLPGGGFCYAPPNDAAVRWLVCPTYSCADPCLLSRCKWLLISGGLCVFSFGAQSPVWPPAFAHPDAAGFAVT